MKKIILVIIALTLISSKSFGQNKEGNTGVSTINSCPVFYLGLSAGFNNPSGLIGLNANLPVSTKLTIGAGVGYSLWGTKAYGDINYFFNPCRKGWAVGAGVTRNAGETNVKRTIHMPGGGKEDVTLSMDPKTNVFFAGYRYWRVGKDANRLYLMFGWSAGVTSTRYHVLSGQHLTPDEKNRINAISPGGLILGLGFQFGFHAKK